ncbi:MAG: transcriptional regulator [Phycisphaerales bacterium]|nr:transcriptional regulator [Phycisphaerales bacterium]
MALLTDARRRVLHRLKVQGGATLAELAEALDLTTEAVRQHLQAMATEGLVESETVPPSGRGRPATRWTLGAAALEAFPDAHADLTVGLLKAARSTLGESGLLRVIDARAEAQVEQYRAAMALRRALRDRVEILASIRSREGYMAEVIEEADGVFVLVEHHCPICAAASACQGLCASELDVFRRTLGEGIEVERITHLLSGGERCAYRIRRAE